MSILSSTARRLVCAAFALAAPACGGGQAPQSATAAPPPATSSETPATEPLTEARCKADGGTVVADIGDGATHRPDFRCPSGKPPVGSLVNDSGQPVGIEGSVCCL